MEILETSAETWWRLASLTGQLLAKLETELPPIESIIQILAELRRECKKLNLRMASTTLDRFGETLGTLSGKTAQQTGDILRPFIIDLHLRICDELQDTMFLVIPSDIIEYFSQKVPISGIDVENAFPEISKDISEAGKCVALGRYTACVFHLSRALEFVVITLGKKLNVTVVDKNDIQLEWGKILGNLRIPIENMPRGEQKEKWSSAFLLLTHTKIAWRNPTMHPKQTYTEQQAWDILDAATSFFKSLAELV